MTDARLPGRWLNDPILDTLSDRLWRVHTGALMWSSEQGTDGLIPRRTLRLLHPDGATVDDARGLVSIGLWAAEGRRSASRRGSRRRPRPRWSSTSASATG